MTLTVPPAARGCVDDVLDLPFFATARDNTSLATLLATLPTPARSRDEEGPSTGIRNLPRSDRSGTAPRLPATIHRGLISSRTVWDVTRTALELEGGSSEDSTRTPNLPDGYDAHDRAATMDFVISLATSLGLTDSTLHLAVRLIDKHLQDQEKPTTRESMRVVAAACLKIADVFTEQSKEYYKQENAMEYSEATQHTVSVSQILNCEKELLLKFQFGVDLPTAQWFLRCFLAYSGFSSNGRVSRTACFICDLMLLDHTLLAYVPSLWAQCAFILAGFIMQNVAASSDPQACSGASGSIERPRLALTDDGSRGPISLPLLELWDCEIRDLVCQKNTAMTATMCLQAVIHTLFVMRREWKTSRLKAVEAKHNNFTMNLVYPDVFPVSKLVRYILPDSQQGIMPE
jgi:hypothetical protein